jgi:HSP20 family protein
MKVLTIRRRATPPASGLADLRLDRTRMEREISTIFDRLFAPAHPFRPIADGGWHPFTDIYENASHFLVRMELAGIDPAKLQVTKEGRCLVVRGERPEPPFGDRVACHQLEISYGTFERVICLPVEFREDAVQAEYGPSGFLHLTISKD